MSTRDQTQAYYDKHASLYDKRTGFAPNTGQTYNLARHYAPFLASALPKTGRVLEIGCGTGFYTKWLSERGVSVVAMDLSLHGVRAAQERFRREGLSGHFVVADAQNLPLKDGAVDTIWSSLLLHHFPKLDRLPDELARDPHGFVLSGRDAHPSATAASGMEPSIYETSLPGVFAVGDVRSGSTKRVAAAVGEGSVVVQQIHQHLTRLLSRLG